MIKKGKGLVLRKLSTIQLIEADLQLIMRIGINHRNKYVIKKDPRVLKRNYRSRPDYSIETAILQNRLIHDNRKLTN